MREAVKRACKACKPHTDRSTEPRPHPPETSHGLTGTLSAPGGGARSRYPPTPSPAVTHPHPQTTPRPHPHSPPPRPTELHPNSRPRHPHPGRMLDQPEARAGNLVSVKPWTPPTCSPSPPMIWPSPARRAHRGHTAARPARRRQETWHYVTETDRVLLDDTLGVANGRGGAADLPAFNPGGPREKLYFEPTAVTAAIVTCGGLCPGLNNVVRGLVLQLANAYGVKRILGFRNGYRGLTDGSEPLRLTAVRRTTSTTAAARSWAPRAAARTPARWSTPWCAGVNMLFVIGGDGTLRGAQKIADVAAARGPGVAVVGIPKTIDNDIPFIDHSFGFQTAFARAAESIRAAHTEARPRRTASGW